MKRITIGIILALFVITPFCFGQGARDETYPGVEGKTTLSAMSLMGQNAPGSPGYIELRGVSPLWFWNSQSNPNANKAYAAADDYNTWYLWVDQSGDLCMASHVTISPYASLTSAGTWDITSMPSVCTKVGGQS